MKKFNWMFYSLYAVVLISYITISNKVLMLIQEKAAMTFDILPSMVWSSIIFIALGALLGLEKLIFEINKGGRWKINLPKILLLGIPSLYFAIGWIFYLWAGNLNLQALLIPLNFFLQGNFKLLPAYQMILGYIIITSFIKE